MHGSEGEMAVETSVEQSERQIQAKFHWREAEGNCKTHQGNMVAAITGGNANGKVQASKGSVVQYSFGGREPTKAGGC